MEYVCLLEELGAKDIAIAGGKNASLGEMISKLPEIRIPEGFVIKASGYLAFIKENQNCLISLHVFFFQHVPVFIKELMEDHSDGCVHSVNQFNINLDFFDFLIPV